jgi:AbiTii
VLADTVPLSSLLQKCIVLGGKAGSEGMRDWARRELNGYGGGSVGPPSHPCGPHGGDHEQGRATRA